MVCRERRGSMSLPFLVFGLDWAIKDWLRRVYLQSRMVAIMSMESGWRLDSFLFVAQDAFGGLRRALRGVFFALGHPFGWAAAALGAAECESLDHRYCLLICSRSAEFGEHFQNVHLGSVSHGFVLCLCTEISLRLGWRHSETRRSAPSPQGQAGRTWRRRPRNLCPLVALTDPLLSL